MHKHILLKALTITALGISTSWADTITLKSGKVLTGKVLEERASEYLLEVNITASIKDQKVIAKSDVLSIEQEAADKKPFEALKGILPTGDQLSEGDYNLIIEGKLKPFIQSYPKSDHLPEVQKTLATLEAEKKRIIVGDIKLSGEWISAEEWNANAYDLDALLIFNEMKKAVNKNSYRAALVKYDELIRNFPDSGPSNEAQELTATFLPRFQRIVAAKASSAKEKAAARERSANSLGARDRSRVLAARDAEKIRYEAMIEKARSEKVRWLPVNDYDEKNLKSLERTIRSEIRSLGRDARDRVNLGELYRELWAHAGKGDTANLKRDLSKFKSSKIDPKYHTLISDHLAANPAPEPVKEEPPIKEEPEPVKEEPKKKKKTLPAPKPADDLPDEEEGSGMMTIVYSILILALIGLLTALFLKKRQSEDDQEA